MNYKETILLVLSIIMGIGFGSFLNVCIYRTPKKIFFSNKRSFCPKCEHELSVKDNIPLFSYIFLRGKCRYCGERISLRYPFVELLNALLWMLVFIKFRIQWITLVYMVLVSLLIVMSFIDIDTFEIPDRIIVVGIIIALISFAPIDGIRWQDKLIGMVAVSLPTFLLAILTNGMGLGDVKLFFFLGLLFGWQYILIIFFFAVLIGATIGVIILIKNKKSGLKKEIPFGPSIAVATIITIFVGQYIIKFYSSLIS